MALQARHLGHSQAYSRPSSSLSCAFMRSHAYSCSFTRCDELRCARILVFSLATFCAFLCGPRCFFFTDCYFPE
eukprot:6199232-Pleurochrysis_carterae.AAC.2